MYIIEKFDFINSTWNYLNSLKSYKKAVEIMNQMKRRIPGEYRIIERD